MLKKQVRTLTIELHLTSRQRDKVFAMMRASAEIYNLLIDFLGYKREAFFKAKGLGGNPWEVDPFSDIREKGWATEVIRTLIPQKACLYPRQDINKPKKNDKDKKERLLPATIKNAEPDYGVPGQTQGLICDDFEASIQSYFSKRKTGDFKAKLPHRKKGLHSLFFSKQLIKQRGDLVILGNGDYVLSLRLPELNGIPIEKDAKITRSRGGKFYLHITRGFDVEVNPELTEVAAIDFGQKRAMVIALKDGTTATISGKEICGLKRERDLRYRGINRRRSRILKGQIRQYLSPEEKLVYRRLQEQDNDRQAKCKPRKGSDIKYALRIISRRRKELGLKKKSKRERKILRAQRKASDYYRIRLNYANHTITRAATDWCVENKVGKVYVGKLNVPKGRKKGKVRIKQVSRNNRWEMPTQVKYLDEKLKLVGAEGTEEASEAFSSQVCPSCGRRHKPKNRNYHCRISRGGCGWFGDRDGVGACNILSSVLTGVCGSIKPAHNRTLRIAPAIRQGLRMHTPDSTAICEPAESVVKEYTVSIVQGSGNVQDSITPKATRKPLPKGKTQARGGKEMLVKAINSDPIGFDDTCSQSTTNKTGVTQRSRGRLLQNQPGVPVQLELWDTA